MRRLLGTLPGRLCLLALLPCTAPLPAQDVLVLSGGGARGLAHVGALEALEALGHSPAGVVGTSMGALVGALYAAGYTPAEIQSLMLEQDWVEAFAERPVSPGWGRPPRTPLLRVELAAWPDGPGTGLVPDWRVNRTLVHLLFEAGARARGNFDRLPRRYRAVAAHVRDGATVVLGHGDLALAARASMAVPGVFSPIAWNGEPLVDGGLSDYLPVAAARELGDRVLAVDVTRPSPDVLPHRAMDLAQRAMELLQVLARAPAPDPDILILPQLPPGASAAIFPADVSPLIASGRTAALAALADVTPRPAPLRTPGPLPETVSGLRIEGAPRALERLARGVLDPGPGGAFDPERVLSGVDRLFATGLVDGVWPALESTGPGDTVGLVLRIQAAPAATAAGALGYDHDRGLRAWGSARTAWLDHLPLEAFAFVEGGHWERHGSAGARLHLPGGIPLTVQAGLGGGETSVRDPAAEGRRRFVRRLGGWVGLEAFWPGPALHASLAVPVEWVRVEGGTGRFASGALARAGTLPRLSAPVATGWSVAADMRMGELTYRTVEVRAAVPWQAADWRAAVTVAGGLAGGDVPLDARLLLGTHGRVPGLEWDEGPGTAMAVAGVDLAHPAGMLGWLRLRLRAGSARLGGCGLRQCGRAGAHLGIFRPTALGPVGAGLALTDRGRVRLELGVGPAF